VLSTCSEGVYFFLAACGWTNYPDSTAEIADVEYQANLSFLDHNRAMLFDLSSPITFMISVTFAILFFRLFFAFSDF